MNPKHSMHRWSASLQNLLVQTHLYQVEALAAFSFAAARARGCHLSRLAALVPLEAQPRSELRRLYRLLANPRLNVEKTCDQMAAVLRYWNLPGCRITLLLDETPQANNWRVVKISLCYRRRAIALCWRTQALSGRSQTETVREVLEQVAVMVKLYAPQAQVVLLADRGLCWPATIDFCDSQGWHYVMRAQSSTQFRPLDANGQPAKIKDRLSLKSLVTQLRQRFKGTGLAFQKAGWRRVNLVGAWMPGYQEAWFLVTNLTPSLHLVRTYAKRMWHEQSFRDEKSHGFCWAQSRIATAEHMHRLLLILALAQLWLTWLGCCATHPHLPWRNKLGLQAHRDRKRWSVFRTGWIFLCKCLDLGWIPPTNLQFKPN